MSPTTDFHPAITEIDFLAVSNSGPGESLSYLIQQNLAKSIILSESLQSRFDVEVLDRFIEVTNHLQCLFTLQRKHLEAMS